MFVGLVVGWIEEEGWVEGEVGEEHREKRWCSEVEEWMRKGSMRRHFGRK